MKLKSGWDEWRDYEISRPKIVYEVLELCCFEWFQNKIDKNLYITELVYYTYEPLSYKDVYYIETHLSKRYNMELVEYVYTTDLSCNDCMRFKISFDKYERSLNDNGYKTEQ